jgi:hypothetical protein
MEWFPFEYTAPNFAPVTGTYRNIGVFTCHAIEQVATLGPALFDALLARFPDAEIHGVHIEPIASQIDASRAAEAAHAKARAYNTDLFLGRPKSPRALYCRGRSGNSRGRGCQHRVAFDLDARALIMRPPACGWGLTVPH